MAKDAGKFWSGIAIGTALGVITGILVAPDRGKRPGRY